MSTFSILPKMPSMRLNLENNELVDMCTYDNRRLAMKCTKFADGLPMVDLLPRVRYCLRVHPTPARECATPPSSLFFTQGLLLIPEEAADGMVRRVVALNLSEKAIRVCAGRELSDDSSLLSPVPSQASSDGGSPSAGKAPLCGAESAQAAETRDRPAFYLEYASLPPPRTAKIAPHPETEQFHTSHGQKA